MATQPKVQSQADDVEVDLFLLSVNAQRAYQESRWIDAVTQYQKIVEYVPHDAAAWFYLANTYTKQGAFERAIHAYEQTLKFDSEQPKAWYNLSSAYLLKSSHAMRQSQSRLPSSDPAHAMISERLNMLGSLVYGTRSQGQGRVAY